ncbi:MAG: protein-export chaperone SecB [Halanaerobiales bacterium]|nr:protein-export chaperone SecB [Halanaerobiales bacterium]
MNAILEFKGFTVEKLLYQRNAYFWRRVNVSEEITNIDLNPRFNFKVCLNPDNYLEANIVIGVVIGNISKEENSPFEVNAIINGFFKLLEKTEKDIAKNFFATNAIAVLFPYLRSLVIDITSKGDHQPLILPTLNIIETVKEYEKENELFFENVWLNEEIV